MSGPGGGRVPDVPRSGGGASASVVTMRIALGNDHAAYDMKCEIRAHLEAAGHEVLDLGHHSAERADYPVYGRAVAHAVVAGEAELGIAICGSGVGISIAANKVPGVRCVCCSEPYSAAMGRRHNDANVLAFGARVVGVEVAKLIVDTFLAEGFEGGKHAVRVGMIETGEAAVEAEPVGSCG